MKKYVKSLASKKGAAILLVLAFAVIGTLLLIFTKAATPPAAQSSSASGNISLSPGSGSFANGSTLTIGIYEDSGSQQVNAVDLGLVFDSSKLTYKSTNVTGSQFKLAPTTPAPNPNTTIITGYLYPGDVPGDNLTGKQLVANVVFSVAAGSGTTSVSILKQDDGARSAIYLKGAGTNIWDGVTTGGTYTLTTPGSGGTSTPPAASPGGFTTTPPAASSGNSGNSTSTTKSTSQAGSNQAASVPSEFTTPSTSGQINLAVTVTDQNDKPAKGVTVTLGSKTAKTDNSGVAYFLNIKAGKYDVKVAGGVLGTATKSITVSSSQTQRVSVKLKKGINYVLYAAIAAAILLLLLFITLARRWFQKSAGESHHFPNKVVVGGSAQNSPDSLDEEIAPVLVTPKLVDDEPSLSKAAETEPEKKPAVRPTDTLDEIEKKVGIDKTKVDAASKPKASVEIGPQIITPEKRTT